MPSVAIDNRLNSIGAKTSLNSCLKVQKIKLTKGRQSLLSEFDSGDGLKLTEPGDSVPRNKTSKRGIRSLSSKRPVSQSVNQLKV